MVRQVFMNETITSASGTMRAVKAIAFGDHPDFDRLENELDDRVVTAGDVLVANHIRVVVDELLIGNNLEEIACRERTDLGLPTITYSRVPLGTTPDDIARCATANDILDSTCFGEHAVCLTEDGTPIGVLDDVPTGGDGASDSHRFIADIVNIDCGGIDVPIDVANTFWQPSGNQQVPAAGEFDAVGPAIIVVTTQGFPTSQDCTIEFDNSVADKDNIALCAPENGGWNDGELDPDLPCEGGDDAGDTSLIGWRTEPLRVKSTSPNDNQSGVPHVTATSQSGGVATDYSASVSFNAPMASDFDINSLVLLENGTARTDIYGLCAQKPVNNQPVPDKPCIRLDADTSKVWVQIPGGLVADASYMLSVTEDAEDAFHVPLPAAQVKTITWTAAP